MGITHPQRLSSPSPERYSPGLFAHRPQTSQHSFQGAAAGTHLPSPTGSHTAAYTAKHGAFWMGGGWYHYPRSVLRGSETLRGRDLKRQTLPLLGLGRERSRRTQKAYGTAMRSCASLLRGVAAPLGCVIPLLFLSSHRWASRFWPTVITECGKKHTSFLCAELLCQLCLRLPPLCCTL